MWDPCADRDFVSGGVLRAFVYATHGRRVIAGENLIRTTMPVHPISATFAMVLLSILFSCGVASLKERKRKEVAAVRGCCTFVICGAKLYCKADRVTSPHKVWE